MRQKLKIVQARGDGAHWEKKALAVKNRYMSSQILTLIAADHLSHGIGNIHDSEIETECFAGEDVTNS